MINDLIYTENEVFEIAENIIEYTYDNNLSINEIMDVYDYYKWSNEDRFNEFITNITNYVDSNGIIIADELMSNFNIDIKYANTELDGYLTSLFYKLINKYGKDAYCINFNNKLYLLELIENEKSCIMFSNILDNTDAVYVDYNQMIKEL